MTKPLPPEGSLAASPLKIAFAQDHPAELASLLASQDADFVHDALHDLPAAEASSVVARLPHGLAARYLNSLPTRRMRECLSAARLNDALALLLCLDPAHRSEILDQLEDRKRRAALKRLLIYPQTTVGALVNPDAIRFEIDMPLSEAVDILRMDVPEPEQYIWLVDGEGKYAGLLDLSHALVAQSDDQKLGELAIAVSPIRAETSIGQAMNFVEWQNHAELAVVDHLGHMLGTLPRASLLDALNESGAGDSTLAGDFGVLTRQYFHVLGALLGDFVGPGKKDSS